MEQAGRYTPAAPCSEQKGSDEGAKPVESNYDEDDAGQTGQSGTEHRSRQVELQDGGRDGGAKQPCAGP